MDAFGKIKINMERRGYSTGLRGGFWGGWCMSLAWGAPRGSARVGRARDGHRPPPFPATSMVPCFALFRSGLGCGTHRKEGRKRRKRSRVQGAGRRARHGPGSPTEQRPLHVLHAASGPHPPGAYSRGGGAESRGGQWVEEAQGGRAMHCC